jgi:two-component system sensor histidine kinase UhpB
MAHSDLHVPAYDESRLFRAWSPPSRLGRSAFLRLQNVLQRLWYDRPVRIQLLIAIGVINLLAGLAAGAISILNTRTATRIEIEASLEVAQRFVSATVSDLAAHGKLEQLDDELPLQLKHLRHVRILVMDAMGQLTVVSPQGDKYTKQAPRWFAALVRPSLAGRAVRVVAVEGANPVVIVGEPADEIAEAWQDFSSLALVWLGLEVMILLVLYVVLGRVLDPLGKLSRGMTSLEDGHYATRLRAPKVREMAVITNRFNTLASALDTAREENSRLYRQLISVQEEERRQIANELHDEAGPCLFGITANASSVKTLAEQRSDRLHGEISRRVDEILSIAERLKLMNRALLKKLRPGSLGRVKLVELLDELIAGFEPRHPDTKITHSIRTIATSYGEAIDLTLYRCVQEAITNAIRHGNASHIVLDLSEDLAPRRPGARSMSTLRLSIRDDGNGMPKGTLKGFGLSTMTERVGSLGGFCEIDSEPFQGTTLYVEIPVARGKTSRDGHTELVRELS